MKIYFLNLHLISNIAVSSFYTAALRIYSKWGLYTYSDLGCPANADQMDDIINGIKLLDNVDLTHIGPEWKDEDEEDESNGMNGNNDEPKPGTSRSFMNNY